MPYGALEDNKNEKKSNVFVSDAVNSGLLFFSSLLVHHLTDSTTLSVTAAVEDHRDSQRPDPGPSLCEDCSKEEVLMHIDYLYEDPEPHSKPIG